MVGTALDGRAAVLMLAADGAEGLSILQAAAAALSGALLTESLLRCVLFNLFRLKMSIWCANWLQAFLFALWMCLPLISSNGLENGLGLVMTFAPMLFLGVICEYTAFRTGNLWTTIVSSFLAEAAFDLLPLQGLTKMDSFFNMRLVIFSFVSLFMILLIRWMADRLHIRSS